MSGSRTAAAILAGGRARRFGGIDKSRLVVEGHPIIVRQVAVLQRVADEVFIVAASATPFADLNLAVHADRIPGAGAIGGLYTALDAAIADLVIVVACDLPFLEATPFERLIDLSAGHDGAWVRTPRGVEPFVACYRRDARTAIRAEIERGRLKARDLGSVLRMAELSSADLQGVESVDRLLTNINSPEDYARVQLRPS